VALKKTKVINLFGAPGHGKSAARSGVFWLMKAYHLSIEEVSEYAKYLVLTGRTWQLKEEQLYLFAKQLHKQNIVSRNGYEFAVTDSPLQLSSFYAPADYYTNFAGLVDEANDRFENLNFFLSRDLDNGDFEERGREHTREASLRVQAQMREYLENKGIHCIDVTVNLLTPWTILSHVMPGLADPPSFPCAPARLLEATPR
jgi:hypothetical protein